MCGDGWRNKEETYKPVTCVDAVMFAGRMIRTDFARHISQQTTYKYINDISHTITTYTRATIIHENWTVSSSVSVTLHANLHLNAFL